MEGMRPKQNQCDKKSNPAQQKQKMLVMGGKAKMAHGEFMFKFQTLARIFALFALGSCPSFAHAVVSLKTQTQVSVTTTSAVLLAANTYRNYLLVVNRGASAVYLKFGSAHAGTEGVTVPVGGNYEPSFPIVDSIYAVAAAGTDTVDVLEGTSR